VFTNIHDPVLSTTALQSCTVTAPLHDISPCLQSFYPTSTEFPNPATEALK
jgi:hypothetical protein